MVASSDKAYGDQEELPYREDTPLLARYPYDVSKACTDLIARSYAVTYDMPVAVSRLANVYGGGDMNFSRLVPDTARALVGGKRPVVRSDGSPERDWIYVEDAVDAYLAHRRLARRARSSAGGPGTPAAGPPCRCSSWWRRLSEVSGSDLDARRPGRRRARRRDRPPGAGRHRDRRGAGLAPAVELRRRARARPGSWYQRPARRRQSERRPVPDAAPQQRGQPDGVRRHVDCGDHRRAADARARRSTMRAYGSRGHERERRAQQAAASERARDSQVERGASGASRNTRR